MGKRTIFLNSITTILTIVGIFAVSKNMDSFVIAMLVSISVLNVMRKFTFALINQIIGE